MRERVANMAIYSTGDGIHGANQDKIVSLYDDQINVIKRGKAGAQVEFGNKLWFGETRHRRPC